MKNTVKIEQGEVYNWLYKADHHYLASRLLYLHGLIFSAEENAGFAIELMLKTFCVLRGVAYRDKQHCLLEIWEIAQPKLLLDDEYKKYLARLERSLITRHPDTWGQPGRTGNDQHDAIDLLYLSLRKELDSELDGNRVQTELDQAINKQSLFSNVVSRHGSWDLNDILFRSNNRTILLRSHVAMDYSRRSLEMHRQKRGKLEIQSTVPLETRDDLATAYTPGVAEPCRAIAKDKNLVWDLTIKGHCVAVVTDGSAVLGLGNIGPEAGLPVMEGKAILFKKFAGIDAFPICLATQDVDEIVETVKRIAPGFGGINLEDISAPRCFEIERRLIEELDIPVMHDDQHGTAVVVTAGLINALKVVGKKIGEVSVVISGAGAGGMGVASLLLVAGVRRMTMLDSKGIIAVGREDMNVYKDNLAARINPDGRTGTLSDALRGVDVFIGVSQPGLVTGEMARSMAPGAIIFAMANPVPEIMPDVAREAGAAVVATGRSDFPNQVNNALAFPGVFKGVLDGRLRKITQTMRLSAAFALAGLIQEPTAEKILPSPLDPGVAEVVAVAVREAA